MCEEQKYCKNCKVAVDLNHRCYILTEKEKESKEKNKTKKHKKHKTKKNKMRIINK